MRNKRGFLLAEESLKIVIALISIGFLIYLLAALYVNNANSQKLKQADEILSKSDHSINSIIGLLNEGNSEVINLENPKGWLLFGFTGDEKPNSCTASCACICDGALIGKQASKCENDGVCINVENLKAFDRIEIKSPQQGLTQIVVKKENGFVLISPKADDTTSEANGNEQKTASG